MAFQQPQQRLLAPRPYSNVNDQPVPASPARKRSLEESQEWILFSPAQRADSVSISQTSQTPRTATHLSDFGSLETRPRSHALDSSNIDDDYFTHQELETDDECAELDSLDDGLHAFHQPFLSSVEHLDQSGGAVLPTHDGFGTFPSSSGIQEQLWQFERFNPQRKTRPLRRRSSLQQRLEPMEEEQGMSMKDERIARIEEWRMEQSKAVLEEIERETRRQRRRLGRMAGANSSLDTRSVTQDSVISAALQSQSSTSTEKTQCGDEESSEGESFWRRITRRVIRDLMGLDESMLSVIFGEEVIQDTSPTPTQPSPIAQAAASSTDALKESRVKFNDPDLAWQVKLLERVAHELGILVHQLSEHEGAFGTYKAMDAIPEYARLPSSMPRQSSLRQRRRLDEQRRQSSMANTTEGHFAPTVPPLLTPPAEPTIDTSLWGIEEEPETAGHYNSETTEDIGSRQEREYWERDIDIKMIFNYLKSRFSYATPEPPPPTTNADNNNDISNSSNNPLLPASWATSRSSISPESQRRAEVIRRQHPLVSRAAERAAAAQTRRRESLLVRRHHHIQSLIQKRVVTAGGGVGVGVVNGGSSCASHSTNRRSRQSRSGGSSRHYWDLGGSAGVGSGVGSGAMSAGLGGWGEV